MKKDEITIEDVKSMNLFEKMSAITAGIVAIAKNLNVGWGKSSYKAVGEADVLAAVKPLEAQYRVYSYPYSRRIVESGTLTSIKQDGSESRQQFLRVETVYRFIDMDHPEIYIDIMTYGDGVDSQDKAPGKAMTYGDKYALLKAYKIITGDDPDQYASEPMKDKETRQARQNGRGAARAPQAANPPVKQQEPQMSRTDALAYINAVCERYREKDLHGQILAWARVDDLEALEGTKLMETVMMVGKFDKKAQAMQKEASA